MNRWLVLAVALVACKRSQPPDLGNVACWGNNFAGQLGPAERGGEGYEPVPVSGFPGATNLALLSMATCAHLGTGWRCTGDLFDLVEGSRSPRPVPAFADVVEVRTATLFGCARRTNGSVGCWGSNLVGELGNGAAPDPHTKVAIKFSGSSVAVPEIPNSKSKTLVDVTGVTDAVMIAVAGSSACAVHRGGTVSCWGIDTDDQLGDGRHQPSLTSDTPVDVVGVSGVTAIDSGTEATCAVTKAGVWCWGVIGLTYDHPAGQVWLTPTKIAGTEGAVEVSVVEREACARTEAGKVLCWDGKGQAVARDLGKAVQLVGGDRHQCIRTESGEVTCWGDNLNGQLGASSTSSGLPPVEGLANVVQLAAGGAHTCVLMKN
jgi:alpha-tubulin suppressor-like RCC1 family protein